MARSFLSVVALAILGLAMAPGLAAGQGFSPEAAAARMAVADGLEVSVAAAEPLVRQPVCIEFDDRGRLWAIQYLQYPNPEGLKRVKVDRYSRTTYDRLPEPPPRGPRGADRISILTDADGDGRMETCQDFVDGLNLTTGLAFGHGGVFVLNVPYLLFYPDRNRDDVPDGDPEVLLAGFGMEDAHSVANSLTWGPDGWLYGCQGSTVTSNIRGIEFQQGVWRYHPRTKEFELFCEGGGNSWGIDFDAQGELMYSTNHGGFVMLHGVTGGYYWKSFGKHGALHNPYAYGYFEHVTHANFEGGHVTAGGIVYQGDLLPAKYRGAYMAADLLGHAIRWHKIAPHGSTYTTANGGPLALGNDTWFAPCDVTQGPDGAVYFADWSDQRTGHPDPDADWDRSNGRVYRLAPPGFIPPQAVDLHALSDDKLRALLDGCNEWYARRARRILAERGDPATIARVAQDTLAAETESSALQRLWTLAWCDGLTDDLALKLLASPHASVRGWVVRLLGDRRKVSHELAAALDDMAEQDASVVVRRQLAVAARRLPVKDAMPILNAMMLRSIDGDDTYVPLSIWWAIEQHVATGRDEVLRRFSAAAWSVPLKRDFLLPRLMRRLAAEGNVDGYAACWRLLQAAPSEQAEAALLASLAQGIREQARSAADNSGTLFGDLGAKKGAPTVDIASRDPAAGMPAEFRGFIASRWQARPNDRVLRGLAVRLGIEVAREFTRKGAFDRSLSVEERTAALELLRDFAGPDVAPAALESLNTDEAEPVRLAALAVLEKFDDPDLAGALLRAYAEAPPAVQSRMRDVLLGRVSWARTLLAAVERGEIPAAQVSLDQVRQVALHGDAELDALVRKLWGNVAGGTPEEKLAEMRRLSNDLRAGPGDPRAGRELFEKHCATCHQLFGEGNKVGPELTTANRQDQNFLLVSLVDPSTVVRKEYLSYIIHTTNGQVLTGLIVEQSGASVTLLDARNRRMTVARDEIEELAESTVSLMAENLYKEFKPQPLRDLFSYLQSAAPAAVPAPKGK